MTTRSAPSAGASSASGRNGRALDPDITQRPIVKELATKLAWAIGSTLHITYGERTRIKEWAEELAPRLYQGFRSER